MALSKLQAMYLTRNWFRPMRSDEHVLEELRAKGLVLRMYRNGSPFYLMTDADRLVEYIAKMEQWADASDCAGDSDSNL